MLKHIAEFVALKKDIHGRSAEERRLIRQQGRLPMHSRSGYAQSVV
jgi:transposase